MSDLDPKPSPDPEDSNPLQFWVAYIPGAGEKKNYLSDGKGNLRVFKTEQALRDWLRDQLRPEVYEMVVVHPVQGQIAIPDDGTFGNIQPDLLGLGRTGLNIPPMTPIRTLAAPTVPSAQELLKQTLKRRRPRRRH